MKYQAILFDFNGLIVDDEPIHYECFKRVLNEEEIDLTEKDYWETYLGFDDKGLIEAIYKRDQKKITPKKIKELIESKSHLYIPIIRERLKLFPGVVDFIKQVQSTHLLAIVSGALRSEIDFVLKEGNIADAFTVIISADDTKHGKPDPEGFLLALAKLKKLNPQIRPDNCLVLEDSHAGIEAGKRARMDVIALTHTYPRKELEAHTHLIADTFGEVLDTHIFS